jgi:hypothetical protein
MTWRSVFPALGLVVLWAAPAGAQATEVRHSGVVREVAPDGSAIVLEEMVAWNGPGTGIVHRSMRLTPRTSIQLIERTDRWDDDRTSLPGWDSKALQAGDLRPGDFVTITADEDRRGVAVALEVVRPSTP